MFSNTYDISYLCYNNSWRLPGSRLIIFVLLIHNWYNDIIWILTLSVNHLPSFPPRAEVYLSRQSVRGSVHWTMHHRAKYRHRPVTVGVGPHRVKLIALHLNCVTLSEHRENPCGHTHGKSTLRSTSLESINILYRGTGTNILHYISFALTAKYAHFKVSCLL